MIKKENPLHVQRKREIQEKNMKYDQEIPENIRLFAGIGTEELPRMLACLGGMVRSYCKGCLILRQGEPVTHIGIMLSGKGEECREDAFGRRAILGLLEQRDIFGEAFICAGIKNSPITITVTEPARVLFLDYGRIVHTCSSACGFHSRLIQNMLKIIAERSIRIDRQLQYLSLKTLREKLMAFLLDQCSDAGKKSFFISMNREQMAEYLAADRSALSRELSKMQADGLIRFQKNSFKLLGGE